MLNAPIYYIRDAYDVVSCQKHAPADWDLTRKALLSEEVRALNWDRDQETVVIDETQELVDPIYPALADPETLRTALFEQFASTLTKERLDALTRFSDFDSE